MTLASERRQAPPPRRPASEQRGPSGPFQDSDQPVEFWSTAAIRSALQGGDIDTWKRIAAALKRDPYGRTARQVEEVLEGTRPYGISKALWEVLERARTHLEANERAEVARHVRLLIDRSGLDQQEFASRIGVAPEDLAAYLDGSTSPSASLMIRMRRLSDRFVKVKSARSPESN
ncbi:helix-turn-helix domain-containing protein [Mycobacterium malmoense]|uniref:Transcriptional regulator n=1 Tax=Mycobacterium malmoense TaxID=1780 RepID=A0ABX3SSC5_MYCMA|nr:transcriptional regulator [Mycobacterium malmoense]ORA82451.1 transcriptional regulator [Mycobacterium malmoense]QZA18002.1 helix-turn-helix domain-containing protein [Mycobacterium malmoense]UNB94779.1 XRE family transcriptional regulator [Mycobacterium malmoense]